jgi:energy-coupling factor transporter transmembrane protein EcfT
LLAAFAPPEVILWLDNPTSWIGLARIVNMILVFMPLSIFLMLVGWLLVVWALVVFEED